MASDLRATARHAAGRFFWRYHFPPRNQSNEGDAGSGDRNDSPWAIVGGIAKAYNFPIDYVLYELSYPNLILLGAVIPSYQGVKDKKKDEEVIREGDERHRDALRELFDKAD